jgi:hypothetical protein
MKTPWFEWEAKIANTFATAMCDDDFRPLLAELEADGIHIYFNEDGTLHVIRGAYQ